MLSLHLQFRLFDWMGVRIKANPPVPKLNALTSAQFIAISPTGQNN